MYTIDDEEEAPPVYTILQRPKTERKIFRQKTEEEHRQLDIKVRLNTVDSNELFTIKALIDTGCTESAIDREFVRKHHLTTKTLKNPILVRNADGTENKDGKVTELVEIMMEVGEDHKERIEFAVTKLSSHTVFLGYDWIRSHNPSIDWRKGTVVFDRCPERWNCKTANHREHHGRERIMRPILR